MGKNLKRSLFVLICLVTVACSTKNNKMYSLDEIAKKNKTYEIINKEYLLSDFIFDCKVFNDTIIFFSEMFTKGLYRFSKTNFTLTKIGGYGKGPGEFLMPGSIAINNDSIIINDNKFPSIQIVSYEGKYIKNIRMNNFITGHSILQHKDELFFLNSGTPYEYFIITSKGKKIGKVPKCFTFWNYGLHGLNMEEFNDIIYFMNPYEMKIYFYDINRNIESYLPIESNEKVFLWDSYYQNKIPDQVQKRINSEEFKIRPIKFCKLVVNNKLFFIVSILNEEKKMLYYSILDAKGKIIKLVKSDNMGLLTTYKDFSIFIKVNKEGTISLLEYRFNEL